MGAALLAEGTVTPLMGKSVVAWGTAVCTSSQSHVQGLHAGSSELTVVGYLPGRWANSTHQGFDFFFSRQPIFQCSAEVENPPGSLLGPRPLLLVLPYQTVVGNLDCQLRVRPQSLSAQGPT